MQEIHRRNAITSSLPLPPTHHASSSQNLGSALHYLKKHSSHTIKSSYPSPPSHHLLDNKNTNLHTPRGPHPPVSPRLIRPMRHAVQNLLYKIGRRDIGVGRGA